jgi:hypothetical protein
MTSRKFILIMLLTSVFYGCNKNIKDPYPEEKACECFAGEYEMYDSLNDKQYTLVVECNPFNSPETNSFDSVTFYNFANLFNVDNRIDGNKVLDGDNIQPLKDKFGIFSNR